ncbi:MAG: bifunctional nuclease domain-containing protein, partial [Flavobacteriaceae bacterium]
LFKNFADRFEIVIKQVIIHKLVDGVFYSSIICERDKIEEIIDARTSDAIALALRFNAPIFTYKTILDKAGIYLKFSSKDKDKSEDDTSIMVDEILQEGETVEIDQGGGATSGYTELSLEELHQELERAVAAEDYEKAAKIRDEISKRN